MNKFTYIDLFAGCGGLSEGFEKTGTFKLLGAVEWEKYPRSAFVERLKNRWGYNDAHERVIHFDAQKINELLNGFRDNPVYGTHTGLRSLTEGNCRVDLIIGGPPCQAYSIAGRIRDEHGMHYDYRNYLFESYLKIVAALRPSVVIFENVEGLLSAKPGGVSIADRIVRDFSSIGYEIVTDIKKFAVIDCSDYGVPQRRKRIILVGIRRSEFKKNHQNIVREFYLNILPKFRVGKKLTVRQAIGRLPAFTPLKREVHENGRKFSHYPFTTSIPNHIPRYHNKRDMKIFRELAMDVATGKNKYISAEVLKKIYTRRTGKVSSVHKYFVLRWDEQSNVIVAHLYKDGLRHIHPDYHQMRSISVREAARLQTFDDDFVFPGGMGDQYKMIGNAVPPIFAEALARSVLILLKEGKIAPKGGHDRLSCISA